MLKIFILTQNYPEINKAVGKTSIPGKSEIIAYRALIFEFLTLNRKVNPKVTMLNITTHQIESAHPFSSFE